MVVNNTTFLKVLVLNWGVGKMFSVLKIKAQPNRLAIALAEKKLAKSKY